MDDDPKTPNEETPAPEQPTEPTPDPEPEINKPGLKDGGSTKQKE